MAEQRTGTFENQYKFNGKELDVKTGYYYYGARYFNPSVGIWLSTDPLSGYNPVFEVEHYIDGQHNGGVFNSKNLHTYGYCYSNPVKYYDPNGKQSVSEFIEGVGEGLGDLLESMAPVRIAKEGDPQNFKEWWDMMKSTPNNIKETYKTGSFKDKVRLTVGLGGALRGKVKSPKVGNVVRNGLNSNSRVSKILLSVKQINFSQRTVSGNINQYISDMKLGKWDWTKSGPIRIMKMDGKWVSYDNRRLMAAQQAGLENIPYKIVKPGDIMPGSKKTWSQAFQKRFNDSRNVQAGGVVPNGGLSSQPKILE